MYLRSRCLRWFGYVSRSDGWINQCHNLDVRGKRGKGRPRKSWDDVIMDDLNSCNLNKESALDRVTWRSIVKSATKTSNPCFKERKRLTGYVCMYVCFIFSKLISFKYH